MTGMELDMKQRRQDAQDLIRDSLPYLNFEQMKAVANTVAGVAMMNRMTEQIGGMKLPELSPDLMDMKNAGTA